MVHWVCKTEHTQRGKIFLKSFGKNTIMMCNAKLFWFRKTFCSQFSFSVRGDFNDWRSAATTWGGRLHLEIFLVGHQVRYFYLLGKNLSDTKIKLLFVKPRDLKFPSLHSRKEHQFIFFNSFRLTVACKRLLSQIHLS